MIRMFFITLIATGFLSPTNEETKTYSVNKIHGEEIIITGKGDSPLWKKATELSDFIYPWENEKAPFTSFKALHSKDWLYCLFKVKDEKINVYVNSNEKSETLYSDRVEIFFRKDIKMLPYYGLELDAKGRIYDYEAKYPWKINAAWSWPTGQLIVKANQTKDGYTVEVAIRKESLIQLGLLKENSLEAGLFRGESPELKGEDASNIKWISWVRPDSKTPDFHTPSSFGVLLLKD